MSATTLMPRQPVPALRVPKVGAGHFVRGTPTANKFDLLVVNRGLHCPLCAGDDTGRGHSTGRV